MEARACAYCDMPIVDASYTYKWFPDKKQILQVHTHHLKARRTAEDLARYNPYQQRKENPDAPPQQPSY